MRIKKPNQIDTDFKAAAIAAEIIENEMNIDETDDGMTDLTLALNNLKLADLSKYYSE